MNILISVVPRIEPLVTRPSLLGMTAPKRPVSPIFSEHAPLTEEYSDADLRDLILGASEHWGGMTFSMESLSSLPVGYLKAIYLNTRYQLNMPMGMMPMRASTELKTVVGTPNEAQAGTEFNPSQHLAMNYCLAAAMFGALFEKRKNTLNPTVRFEAMNHLRLVNHLYYILYDILLANPSGAYNDRCVIGQLNEYRRVGDVLGHTVTIYFDKPVYDSYIAAGATETELVEYWLEHKEQPPAP